MDTLSFFWDSIKKTIGMKEFENRLEAIDTSIKKSYSSSQSQDLLFLYIAICTALSRKKTESYIAIEYSRIYPMLFNLNRKWQLTTQIGNFDEKFDDLCSKKPSQHIDSIFFEILVALSYIEQGYKVEFIKKTEQKTPDLQIYKDGITEYIECKKMQRANAASYEELKAWYLLSEQVLPIIIDKNISGHIHFKFKLPLKKISHKYILKHIKRKIASRSTDKTFRILDNNIIKIVFTPFLQNTLNTELDPLRHITSPSLIQFLTGKYNYRFTYRTIMYEGLLYQGYVDRLQNGAVFSCQFAYKDFPQIRSQHIKRLLVDAAKQITKEHPGKIHILIEECHGDKTYTERIMKNIEIVKNFVDKNMGVKHIFIHYIKYITPPDKTFDVEETVQHFSRHNIPSLHMPCVWYIDNQDNNTEYGNLLTDY